MSKFTKAFGRRKSSVNGLEHITDEPVPEQQSTFKVFDRADGGSKTFGGGAKFVKAANGAFGRSNTSHLEEDNMFDRLGKNRGSGASNTNTASTTDNSSRLSAASTAPSSTDVSGREEGRSHDKRYGDIPVPPIPKSTSAFSLKNAGRTFSFGRVKNSELPSLPQDAKPPTPEEQQSGRARAVTASSYASTATPPKLDERDLGLSLGGDFSDMFAGFGKRKSQVLDAVATKPLPQSPETLPSEPASRSLAPSRSNQPPPLSLDKKRDVEPSPYSWSSHNSADGLISNSTPPPIPPHNSSYNKQPQRPGGAADTGLRRSSGYSGKRRSTIDYGDAIDDDARLLRESLSASRRLNDPSHGSRARDSWLNPLTTSQQNNDSVHSNWKGGSVETTPRAKKTEPRSADDDLFDNHIVEAASAAQRYQEQPLSPPTQHAPQNKVMTPAQFERYRQDKERLRSLGGQSKTDDDDDDEPETYDDEEDEAEKAREAAKQRRKQEAHMSVYRQQMMKVTGETSTPTAPSRSSLFPTQSSPNLMTLGQPEDNEEEDEEIPLAILQAHGFPNKNRLPVPRVGSNPNMRGSMQSAAGGVVDPRLPAFARNLPEDPYIGAGLVNPLQRESMAFGGGAGSAYGGSSRALHPGGLVGVIATEERSRAMRRGSPNPQGEYGPVPPHGMGMPPNMRPPPGSMMNGMMPGPMSPMGPMNPMMLTPGDQAQIEMSQQMAQFMQMQMQFMQMMTSGQGGQGQTQMQPNGHMPQQPLSMQRSDSPQLRPSSGQQHQRSMTMMEPNLSPWMQQMQGGSVYAPSIAPSERSNVGLPGRYRPVSHMPIADTKSRTSTMSGALQGWDNKHQSVTVRPVRKSETPSDEDDEEGWEEMAKKREKKKSKWRMKKDTNGLKEMLGYTQ
ncbi:Uncharacterized protein BP5553_07733 [Venustampulla echinocandica]|uniref:Uncharacterized protein n=1 Tax=Venustampulla echinocandica TaxID=2656787 RepID=A0A370THD1_9HELO|nr:Uncharacterized protein BP5553_07733 [Venustampulla echinocandica]RDL34605.1 Uncharacterized protein BP5553_07733 [Venustampulla echinocandica]